MIPERGRGQGDSPQPCGAQIPPGLAAQVPEGPSRARGDPAVPPPKLPRAGGCGSGDIWSETRWRQSPDLRLRGISWGWGTRRAAPSPCAAPRGSQKSEISMVEGKGNSGAVWLHSLSSIWMAEQGQSLQTCLSQLMDSRIPENPSKPQTTAPRTDAARGSWHGQGLGSLLGQRLGSLQCPRLGPTTACHQP